MRFFRYLTAALAALALAHAATAADPVVVSLPDRAAVGSALVTIGDVAAITGGDADTRAKVARIDLAELKTRDTTVILGRQSVGYRLQLAGFDPQAVRVTGAERVAVSIGRRPVAVDEVVSVAKAELLRQLPDLAGATVELAVPVAVKLPEVPTAEPLYITAKPRSRPAANGRVQMDMTVGTGAEPLLAFAVHLEVKPAGAPVRTAGGTAPAVGTEVLVRARERVEVTCVSGGAKLVMAGEAQQDGRLGQTISVLNPTSKKTIAAKVVGPGKLEVELGGTSP